MLKRRRAEPAHDLAANCHVEDRRPCDIAVSVGYARDLARDAGIPAPELDRLLATGAYHDEGEIKQALQATRSRLPDSARGEADAVIGYLWPAAAAKKGG
ncbi:MAG TPA: hypothetical protein VGK74_22150 [Symbiobacteriaceae bacterium]|jgi:hypothetical protein